jgi:hypothetical protein
MRLSRRTFLSFVPAVPLLHLRQSLQSAPSELVLEQCPVAGFACHQGPALFEGLRKDVEPDLVERTSPARCRTTPRLHVCLTRSARVHFLRESIPKGATPREPTGSGAS